MKTPTVNRRTASYIVLGVTAVIIILTFFTATREFLYGIFGYAVYAYIPAALLTGILMYLGKKTTLPKSKVALYVALFFSALLTLHIALSKELVGEANYLTATYSGHTVGGALIGLPAALLHLIFPNYSFMLVAALVITAALLFAAIYPFVKALLFAAIYPFVKDLGSGKKPARGRFTKRPRENDTEFRDSFKAAPKTAPKTAPLPEHFATESRDGDSDVVNVTGMSDEDFIKPGRTLKVFCSKTKARKKNKAVSKRLSIYTTIPIKACPRCRATPARAYCSAPQRNGRRKNVPNPPLPLPRKSLKTPSICCIPRRRRKKI